MYRSVKNFLDLHTEVVELVSEDGGRVAVCPQWQGRVMTSTCGGPDWPSFGFVNRAFIEAETPNPRLNNYGGEERMWLSPEGGQFSLWFAPGAEQTVESWYTPPALNEGAWEVLSQPDDPDCMMTTTMQLTNASCTPFQLDVARDVRILDMEDFREWFGDKAAKHAGDRAVKMIGYETANQVLNQGPPLREETGLVSIWILGMLCAGPQTVVIVPYKEGDESEMGPPVRSDYFGHVPPDRLRVLPGVALFRADGSYRSKIGTSQARARNLLGSIDFAAGVLTIVRFSMPEDPVQRRYMNNLWGGPHEEPYRGDVANAYNDGPNPNGEQLGPFYEIESLSPALALETGQALAHRHRTIHLVGELAKLDKVAREVFGVDLETVRREML
jgi:hypothetical protein